MKKSLLLLFFVFNFFIFSLNVFANDQLSNVSIDIEIDDSGDALVVEKWGVKDGSGSYLTKRFDNLNDVKITNVSIDSQSNSYIESDNLTEGGFKYNYSIVKNTGFIRFTTNGKSNVYTISYKVEGMIKKYNDVTALNWTFLEENRTYDISSLNIHIVCSKHFNDVNTSLYGIGGDDLSVNFENDKLHIFDSNISRKQSIKLMAKFNNLDFEHIIVVDKNFNEAYNEEIAPNGVKKIREFFSGSKLVVLIIVIVIIICIVVSRIVVLFKKHDEYEYIKTLNDRTIKEMKNEEYYDTVPCGGNIYRLSFLAGYFKLIKDKSDLIGAILLKWIYLDIVKVTIKDRRVFLTLEKNQMFDNELDSELYDILMSSSKNGLIENNMFNRYCSNNSERIINWYKAAFNSVIECEYNKQNISRVKKGKNSFYLVLNDKLLDSSDKILGLKKYLLNFNQVPRKTELNEEGFRYLLISAELLGISKEVAKEILRKNPDNILASQILVLDKAKHIYKNAYSLSLMEFKQTAEGRKKLKIDYDPEEKKEQ